MALRNGQYLLIILVALLSACQPSYMADTGEHFARKVGVVNNFTITRWNNLRVQAHSRVVVVSDAIKDVDGVSLSRVLAQNFSPYFLQVDGGFCEESLTAARVLARQKGHNLVFYVQIGDASSLYKSEEAANESTSYNHLALSLIIQDVVSGKVIDKISLQAKSSWVQLLGDDMQGLLKKSVATIGKNLTGV